MDRNAYGSTREHINAHLADTANKIKKSVFERDRLTTIDIQNASNDLMNWELYVSTQKKELDALKGRLEESRKRAAVSADMYKLLQKKENKQRWKRRVAHLIRPFEGSTGDPLLLSSCTVQ